jgi:hypothetical protein
VTNKEISARATQGLEYALLIMLCPLFLNGIVLLVTRRWYATDVVTAVESDRVSAVSIGAGSQAEPA